MTNTPGEDSDWVDLLVRLGALVGLNPIRVRWKLERLRKRVQFEAHETASRVTHVQYEHKTCGQCGAIHDRDDIRCASCGEALTSRRWQVFQRVGLSLPGTLSVSSVLCLAMVTIYVRMIASVSGAEGGGWGVWSFDGWTLVRFGGSWPAAIFAGQWWRLGTCIFLHAGIWHIGFNVYALAQIGPGIEQLFGRARTLWLFMVTGVAASTASLVFLDGVGIGASGAIMGLIGLAAGWGHRDATTVGRGVRNRMVKWALYVLVFGFFIGADNVAHLAGFVSGSMIGFVIPAGPQHARRPSRFAPVHAVLGGAAALGCTVLCLFPPGDSGRFVEPDEWALGEVYDPDLAAGEGLAEYYGALQQHCPLVRAGRYDAAQEALTVALYLEPAFWKTLEGGNREPYLDALCDGLDWAREFCVEYETNGVSAVHGPDLQPQADPAEIERAWSLICAELSQPVSSGKTP